MNKRRDEDVEPHRYGINWGAIAVVLTGVAMLGAFGLWVMDMSFQPIKYRLGEIEKRIERLEQK